MSYPLLSDAKRKLLVSLSTAKGRKKNRAFLAEGARLVESGIDAGHIPELLVLRADVQGDYLEHAERAGDRCFLADAEAFKSFSETVNSQGIIAAFPLPRELEPLPAQGDLSLLVLDQLRDPGNVGALIRHAAAFGVKRVQLTKGCCDPYNEKAVRSSMGGIFVVEIESGLEPGVQLEAMEQQGIKVFALENDEDARSIYATQWPTRSAIIVGGEAEGISGAWSGRVSTLTIPQSSRIESLNAAAAAAIAMSHRCSSLV